jgi:hypothetical protein
MGRTADLWNRGEVVIFDGQIRIECTVRLAPPATFVVISILDSAKSSAIIR